MLKISIAAKAIGVTPKTIYNWIDEGLLTMPEPGYVNRKDVYRVFEEQNKKRSDASRTSILKNVVRDERGRFIRIISSDKA